MKQKKLILKAIFSKSANQWSEITWKNTEKMTRIDRLMIFLIAKMWDKCGDLRKELIIFNFEVLLSCWNELEIKICITSKTCVFFSCFLWIHFNINYRKTLTISYLFYSGYYIRPLALLLTPRKLYDLRSFSSWRFSKFIMFFRWSSFNKCRIKQKQRLWSMIWSLMSQFLLF